MPVLILFFCSGATALIYEVIWSKYLALMLGSTIQAQTVVLAVFMGGLALGNRLFGVWADRVRQPLALYGYLEVAIGLYAFFFSSVYKLADAIFVKLGSGLLEQGGSLLGLKGILSVALLLGPTFLMGGTLPVLAGWLQKRSGEAGRLSARFYSTNSLGAVCGAWLAGFYLVQWLGLPVTLQMTALVNVIIGFTAVGIARRQGNLASPSSQAPAAAAPPAETSSAVFRAGCVLVAMTGGVSMGLEVLASRCLSLIFGASLQAFAIVLMAFILGIGIGSAVIASPRRRHWPKETTTIALLLSTAALLGFLVYNIEGLVDLYRYARSGLGRTTMGYRYHQIITATISMVVLGLPAAALGSMLPLWIRIVSEHSTKLGNQVGRLLTWNTLGAVGGVLLTGFVLMPKVGLRGSFGTLAIVLAVAAILIALVTRRLIAAGVATVVTGSLLAVCLTGGEGWRQVLSSGVFRKHETEVYANAMKDRRRDVRILFYEDAADATVSVEQGDIGTARGQIKLRINGKVDASSHGDLSTQYLLAHLPLMANPDSKEVFVLGLGSGITAGAVLGHPVGRLTIAENCEPVVRAAKFFEPWNNGVLTKSRARILREDARTVLKLDSQQYDVIISEPSNPWMVGVGSVFSREFYELAARRLKPGGVMAQWFHVYEMSDGIVELVLRTFSTVFPHVEIWDASEGDIIMLGSAQPWAANREVYARTFAREGPRRELIQVGLATPEAVWARQFASQRTGFAIPGDGPIQQDDLPVLEYAAPEAFYLGQSSHHLHRFDERTWQTDIAPTNKPAALATVDGANLKAIFGGDYTSVNPDLQKYLRMRFFGGNLGDSLEVEVEGRPLPCVFRPTPTASVPAQLAAAALTNQVARQLVDAEAWLHGDPAKQADAILAIERILTATVDSGAAKPFWSPADYAGLAAKASLRQGNSEQARKILLRGLELEPYSDQLLYLARIFTREKILQPRELAEDAVQ